MISLVQVTKKFGLRLAVADLTLAVPRGEIFGLLGHNGAGKSTAIGMMLGQVWPTSGAVKVCGHDVTTQRALALQKVGAIFEAPAFYDYLSGWRNLEILSHYSAPTSAARIREVVDWVGLTGREQSKVRTYSHGMRARLALAQALLPQPEMLILDEPGNGLDPEGIAEMRQTIARLHRAGFKLAATTVRGGESLYASALPARVVLMLGAESTGLPQALVDRADLRVRIPGTGAVESLNVSVASALLIAEWARVRGSFA
jgi:ABC-type multidrug transport system ATPase subunit